MSTLLHKATDPHIDPKKLWDGNKLQDRKYSGHGFDARNQASFVPK